MYTLRQRSQTEEIIKPFSEPDVVVVMVIRGNKTTRFPENQVFLSYFPNHIKDVKTNYFCNNANCAIRRKEWNKINYDESLTGLEDLDWAKKQYQMEKK